MIKNYHMRCLRIIWVRIGGQIANKVIYTRYAILNIATPGRFIGNNSFQPNNSKQFNILMLKQNNTNNNKKVKAHIGKQDFSKF